MDGSVLLSAVALTKRFSLAAEVVTALDHLTLEIREGDFTAVMGPSGSGKTTLLNLLSGLDLPTEGSVHWRGQSFGDWSEHKLAALRCAEIGLVFQDSTLMSGLDALDNVRLPQLLSGSTDRTGSARQLLERLGLGSKVHRMPTQLSRGEKQRVAIARALVNEPILLVADEPTGNLDRAATSQIFATFQELNENRGLTVVVATHDESVLDYATRKIVLSDGQVTHEADR